jgi:hypothetical protein
MNNLTWKQKLYTIAEFLTMVWIFLVFTIFLIVGNA